MGPFQLNCGADGGTRTHIVMLLIWFLGPARLQPFRHICILYPHSGRTETWLIRIQSLFFKLRGHVGWKTSHDLALDISIIPDSQSGRHPLPATITIFLLSYMGSNHRFQIQNLTCYSLHYTTICVRRKNRTFKPKGADLQSAATNQ